MNWAQLAWSTVSALAGGFIGGWIVAYRVGKWQAQIEQRVVTVEARLAKGDEPVGQVPVLIARVEMILSEIRDMKRQSREDMQRLVSREECDRRHGDGG